MRTVAVLSQKGGTGKTTIAVGLAAVHEWAGGVAAVIDMDPQGSASVWRSLRNGERPEVVATTPRRMARVINEARNAAADLVLIDTPPAVAGAALAAARVADLALVPCRAGVADLLAIDATLDLCRQVDVPAVVVVNAAPVRGPLADQAREACVDQGAEVAPVVLHQRIAHMHAFTRGQSAMEFAPKGKAAAELEALLDWLADAEPARWGEAAEESGQGGSGDR